MSIFKRLFGKAEIPPTPIEPAPEPIVEAPPPVVQVVVAATGVASNRGARGKAIEDAMAGSIHAASLACEEVWARNLSVDAKNKIIAEIMAPEAIKARMMAARAEAKANA